ncbi:hypothetical protein KVT40_003732 [Elsinoe batatas]|uniref:Uncharacterized protein n=1 Tax=Elsinoe batatas TaxID=2601811 RepID=A0A8K0L1A1_9PEZI|nr:hypothetical protein KVT40_003732 [Elsinoe batatas]
MSHSFLLDPSSTIQYCKTLSSNNQTSPLYTFLLGHTCLNSQYRHPPGTTRPAYHRSHCLTATTASITFLLPDITYHYRMPRHSRQGSDDSPGHLCQGTCHCSACTCQCSCQRIQQDLVDMDTDTTLVDTDNDSIMSEETEDINQPDREPTPGLQALEAQARHIRPFLRYPQALPSHIIRDEGAWVDLVQYIIEVEHLRRSSRSPSMEASFVSTAPSQNQHDDMYEYPHMHESMIVETNSHSPFSSMENSMYRSFSSSRQSSNSPGHPFRSNSSAVLEGIGALFDQPNWFTTSPLKLGPESEYCLATLPIPTRSLSLPAIKVDQPLDQIAETA